MRILLFAFATVLGACTSGASLDAASGDPDDDDGPRQGSDSKSSASSAQGGGYTGVGAAGGGTGGVGGQAGGDPIPNVAVDPPVLSATNQVCKLINDVDQWDPTPNATQTRANVLGTDLGIPVAHGSDLFLFFGDTVGYQVIWPFSESVPDAVGFAVGGRAAVAADPSVLCDGLRFLRVSPAASAGPLADPAIEADFAAGAMYPPSGHELSEYIKNPAGPIGQNAFPALPGTFEVPSGAFSHGGSIYVFYTTVQAPNVVSMKASYLAKWPTPSTSGSPNYDILHRVDERFSGPGPLGGNFINIAAEPHGAYVYLFGTGDYRHSAIHLARKPLASLDTAGSYEVFDAAAQAWLPAPAANAAPIIVEAEFGETSVRYFPEKGIWMFLAHGDSRIVARFANDPEGPWSPEITLHDNTDPAFLAQYCCFPEGTCAGERLFNCSKASFYGTYLFPDLAVDGAGFSVTYTMSTWDPYNVALFTARFDES